MKSVLKCNTKISPIVLSVQIILTYSFHLHHGIGMLWASYNCLLDCRIIVFDHFIKCLMGSFVTVLNQMWMMQFTKLLKYSGARKDNHNTLDSRSVGRKSHTWKELGTKMTAPGFYWPIILPGLFLYLSRNNALFAFVYDTTYTIDKDWLLRSVIWKCWNLWTVFGLKSFNTQSLSHHTHVSACTHTRAYTKAPFD